MLVIDKVLLMSTDELQVNLIKIITFLIPHDMLS